MPHAVGWPVKLNGPLPGWAILPVSKVDVVKQMIHPRAAIVLIYAHGPQRQHLQIRIGIHTCQLLDIRRRHTGDFLGVFERIGLQALSVFLERDGADRINLLPISDLS